MKHWTEADGAKPASSDELLLKVGADVLRNAFASRHRHRGYMAEYWQGRMVCLRSLAGNDPMFASWF